MLAGPDDQTYRWLEFPNLVKRETVSAVERIGYRAPMIADRWALGSPKKVKAMEADGTLIEKIRAQHKLEIRTLSDARVAGRMADVPDSEILAMNEIPQLP